jgi:hypothetical protein
VTQLVKMAQAVVNKGGWFPDHAMIDKSHAEYNALKNGEFLSCKIGMKFTVVVCVVWMDINIRLCQFHIIQALIRWGKSKAKKAKKGGKAHPHHGLNEDALQDLLALFRQAQRCRDSRTWKTQFLVSFNRGIDDISKEHKCNANAIKAYFLDNWWGTWLGMSSLLFQAMQELTDPLYRIYH